MTDTQIKSAEALLKLLLDECGCSLLKHDPLMTGNTVGAVLVKTQNCRYNVGVTAELALALAVQRHVEAEVRRQLRDHGVSPTAGAVAAAANITPQIPLAEPFMVQAEHLGASVVKEADYETLRKDRDLHYARCATMIFSPAFSNVTGAEARLWLVEYEDARAKLQEAIKTLGDYYINGELRLSIGNLVSGLDQEISVKESYKRDIVRIEELARPFLPPGSFSAVGAVEALVERCDARDANGFAAAIEAMAPPELADERPLPVEVNLDGITLQPGVQVQILMDVIRRLIDFESVQTARRAPPTVIIIDEDHARGG